MVEAEPQGPRMRASFERKPAMPKAFPLAHDAGHGPGTRHGDGTDEKGAERLPPGALEDSLGVAGAAYLLVSRSWAHRWLAATTGV